MADAPKLGDLVPVEPEELLTRGALGAPGRLRIEVGLTEPRFGRPEGRRTAGEDLDLRRALGGVAYPATRERVIAEAGRWLRGKEAIQERLQTLPELVYGGEMEVMHRLEAPLDPGNGDPGQADEPGISSAGPGNDGGSSASR
ncbi:MAG TPA: hypothetical protein VI138_07905 [Candidatus Dormibacteraeota bacterium]